MNAGSRQEISGNSVLSRSVSKWTIFLCAVVLGLLMQWGAVVHTASQTSLLVAVLGGIAVIALVGAFVVGSIAPTSHALVRGFAALCRRHWLVATALLLPTAIGLVTGRWAAVDEQQHAAAAAAQAAANASAAADALRREAAAEQRRVEILRQGAVADVVTASKAIEKARAAEASGDFALAAQSCMSVHESLDKLAVLNPPPPGVQAALEQADQLRASVSVGAATEAIARARAAYASGDFRLAAEQSQVARTGVAALVAVASPAPEAQQVLKQADQIAAQVAPLVAALDVLAHAHAATASSKTFPNATAAESALVAVLAELRSIPSDVAQRYQPEIRRAEKEVELRARAAHREVAKEAREAAKEAREEALAEANTRRALRDLAAQHLDAAFIAKGIEVNSVRAAGKDRTTLRIAYALCGRVFVTQVVRSMGASLQRDGFTRVECDSGFETTWNDL